MSSIARRSPFPRSQSAAISEDRQQLIIRNIEADVHYRSALSLQKTNINNLFRYLCAWWRHDTRFSSDLEEIVDHPAYRTVIALGNEVVPLIIEDLKKKPDHWFYALIDITGENPITPDIRGDVEKMSQAWIDWAKERSQGDSRRN
jgi:hypothetical protein